MNSIVYIFRDRSLWLASLSISVLFLIVPFLIFNYSYYLCFGVAVLIMYMALANKRGGTCVIFAYSLMIPYNGLEGISVGVTFYIPYVAISLWYIINLFFKKQKINYNFFKINIISVMLIFIAFIFAVKNSSYIEIRDILPYLIAINLFFYICFLDKITLSQFFCILDIIFYFTLFFVIQENIFHKSPYQNIYNNLTPDFQLRAKGIIGHPLVLSSFLSFYHMALIIKGLIFKKWSIFNLILLLPLIVLLATKTIIVLIIASWTIYFILSKSYKMIKFYLVLSFSVFITFQTFPLFKGFVTEPLARVIESRPEQRLGAYSVATQVFENNILGIGLTRDALKNELNRSTYTLNSNYDVSFLIFDNSYLTALASYGILAILLFFPYINPILFFRKRITGAVYKKYKNSIFLLFSIWFLQNFSFDTILYFPVNSFYFMMMAFIIKDFYKRSKVESSKIALLPQAV